MKLISVLVPGLMTIAAVNLSASQAIAFSVTQTSDPAQLQARLFGASSPLTITQFNLGPIPAAFGLFQEDDFLGLGQGLVISTGEVNRLAGVNCADGSSPDRSCSNPALPRADLNFDFANVDPVTKKVLSNPLDRVSLDIRFEATQSGWLNFNYVFGSEEFPEFVPASKTTPSDILYILLADANNVLRGSKSTNVFTAFNSTGFNPNLIGAPNSLKTPLDGYTAPIQVMMPFTKGSNHLIFSLEDVNGDGYDSAVFLQQISVQTDKPPSVPTPSLLFGFTCMGWRRWRDRHKSR
jgi:hypothetical protein